MDPQGTGKNADAGNPIETNPLYALQPICPSSGPEIRQSRGTSDSQDERTATPLSFSTILSRQITDVEIIVDIDIVNSRLYRSTHTGQTRIGIWAGKVADEIRVARGRQEGRMITDVQTETCARPNLLSNPLGPLSVQI